MAQRLYDPFEIKYVCFLLPGPDFQKNILNPGRLSKTIIFPIFGIGTDYDNITDIL